MNDISSPCVSVCKMSMHAARCVGCGRTVEMIEEWTLYTEEERIKIMEELEITKAELGGQF